MANVTDPVAVKFSNEEARVLGTEIMRVYRTIEQFLLDVVTKYEQRTGGHLSGDLIEDGSPNDGRLPVTHVQVAELKFVCEQIKLCLDTDDRLANANDWNVNATPLF